jgi:hypothetical protein
MATLADELLNDFDDTGSEEEEQQQDGFLEVNADRHRNEDEFRKARRGSTPGMELDGDEEEVEDEEDEFAGKDAVELKDAADEEETKAKVEKMKLGGVSDVRNVAGLMKTLQPVLEVRLLALLQLPGTSAFTSLSCSSPDFRPSRAENRTSSIHTPRETDYYRWVHRRQPRV